MYTKLMKKITRPYDFSQLCEYSTGGKMCIQSSWRRLQDHMISVKIAAILSIQLQLYYERQFFVCLMPMLWEHISMKRIYRRRGISGRIWGAKEEPKNQTKIETSESCKNLLLSDEKVIIIQLELIDVVKLWEIAYVKGKAELLGIQVWV